MTDTTDDHDYHVSEEEYYKLLAHKNEVDACRARLQLAEHKFDAVVESILRRASEGGQYQISGNFLIDETHRTLQRTPVG